MMASEPAIRPNQPHIEIDESLRDFLHLTETDTHYVVQTLSGAIVLRPKNQIAYSWQLLRGIMDDGKDTTEERHRERNWELAHDEQKFGRSRIE